MRRRREAHCIRRRRCWLLLLLPPTAQSIAWEVVGLATPGTAVAGQAAMLASRGLIAPSAGEPTGIAAIALTALVAPLLEYNASLTAT